VFYISVSVFVAVGAVVVSRSHQKRIGWLLIWIGIGWLVTGVSANGAGVAWSAGLERTATNMGWLAEWVWVLPFIPSVWLVALFPDGRLQSRWWGVATTAFMAAAFAIVLGTALRPGPLSDLPLVDNPFGIPPWEATLDTVLALGDVASALLGPVICLAPFFRLRSSGSLQRRQLATVLFALAILVPAWAAVDIIQRTIGMSAATAATIRLSTLPLLPLAVGVAILRYRLYDIDLVIRPTAVFAMLAALVGAIYVAVVAGVGGLIGRTLSSDVALAVVATAVAALVLQPARSKALTLTKRMVYGPSSEPPPPVALLTLGGFRLFRDGRLIPAGDWGSKKARTALKLLVARRGRSTTRDQLMDVLWPGEDPSALRNRLAVVVSTIRNVLDPDQQYPSDQFVVSDHDGVWIVLESVEVDVEIFLREAERGLRLLKSGEVEAARRSLEKAEVLYRGDFLEEDLYEDWAESLRKEALAAYITVCRELASIAHAANDAPAALRYTLRVLDRDPWNEEAHLALVATFRSAGRHGEALRGHERYVEAMSELGVTPVPLSDVAPPSVTESSPNPNASQ
jgi:DNA-binding SARP family transcriptional activator